MRLESRGGWPSRSILLGEARPEDCQRSETAAMIACANLNYTQWVCRGFQIATPRVEDDPQRPPHAAAYPAAQPDPKPRQRPVKPEGDRPSRAPLLEELVDLLLHLGGAAL